MGTNEPPPHPCIGAVLSNADALDKIIDEIVVTWNSERIMRLIDRDTESSTEYRRREGYFQ